MGSLLMHVCVSKIVKEKLDLSNKFLFGTVMPDFIKLKTGQRNESHYIKKVIYNNGVKELPDIERFILENRKDLKNEETRGYLAHLIEDKIWFDKYISKYVKRVKNNDELVICLKNGCFKDNKKFTDELYSDYRKMGGYLVNKYNIDIKNLKRDLSIYLNDEVYFKFLQKYCTNNIISNDNPIYFITKQDMNYYIKETVEEVLKVLNGI
ncbi:MAG: hypothetical protein Q4D02_00725 [Clostridia bacterium]|nr:hypothetical protein [Clostridia bacterium]